MTVRRTRFRQLSVLAVLIALGLASVGMVPAVAQNGEQAPPPEPEGGVTEGDLDASIRVWDPTENIIDLGDNDDEENVLVLETDILFSSNEWELPSHAGDRIVELVEVIPEGASVEVNGHTDSLPVDESQFDFDNQELSENRAQAVADALAADRPDLTLDVQGFGDSQPAVNEDPEDPSTFAANRRVEIRYD